MRRIAPLLFSLAALIAPAPALAGDPFTIGEGSEPHLLVDADGTAHVAWVDDFADVIRTCEVPRGATACTDEETLAPFIAGSPAAPFLVRRSASTLDIVSPHYVSSEVHRYTSTDNGATWSAAQKIYDRSSGTGPTEPILNAAGTEFVIPTWNPGRYIVSAAVNGSEQAVNTEATLASGGVGSLVYDLMVGRAGATYIATAHNLDSTYFWTSANPSTNTWSGAPTLVGQIENARLASDGTNAYVMGAAGTPGNNRVEVHKWTGAAFNGAVSIANDYPYIADLTVSPSGGVGGIWRRNDNPNRLQFALSTNGGASFSVNTITREDVIMRSMDIALATDNQGFAVYEGGATPSTNLKSFIRMANTDTVPEPPAPPTTTTGGTTTTPTTTTTTLPRPTVPVATTALLPARFVSTRVPGATIRLGLPRGCIPAGRPFVVTLTWRRQRRKGNLFVRIFRTDFYIGTRRVRIDRRAPFRQTLRIPNPRRGQSYRFRARAFIKVRRGRSPKKSIFSTLRVCS